MNIHVRICLLARGIAAVLAAQASPVAAARTELEEVWERPPVAVIPTRKTAEQLELCIGNQVADHGIPSVLRGEREMLLMAWVPNEVQRFLNYLVSVKPGTIEIRTKRGPGKQKLIDGVRACA